MLVDEGKKARGEGRGGADEVSTTGRTGRKEERLSWTGEKSSVTGMAFSVYLFFVRLLPLSPSFINIVGYNVFWRGGRGSFVRCCMRHCTAVIRCYIVAD